MDRNDQSGLDTTCMAVKLAFKRLLEQQAISKDTERNLAKGIFHSFEVIGETETQSLSATDSAKAQLKAHLMARYNTGLKVYEVLPLIEGIQ